MVQTYIPKCVYWFDIYSVNVWWRYMLSNCIGNLKSKPKYSLAIFSRYVNLIIVLYKPVEYKRMINSITFLVVWNKNPSQLIMLLFYIEKSLYSNQVLLTAIIVIHDLCKFVEYFANYPYIIPINIIEMFLSINFKCYYSGEPWVNLSFFFWSLRIMN